MSSKDYTWEFGFDFNAQPDWGKLNAGIHDDPTEGDPICLLQNGLVNNSDSNAPQWPSRLEVGDTIQFQIFDLTGVFGGSTPSGHTINSSTCKFNFFNPASAYAPQSSSQGFVHPFSDSDQGPAGVRLTQGTANPRVWPGGTLPYWQVSVDLDGGGSYDDRLELKTGIQAALSLLIQVSDGSGTSKWFGLDPEMWIRESG